MPSCSPIKVVPESSGKEGDMNKIFLALIALSCLTDFASAADRLNDAQMDRVTAGAIPDITTALENTICPSCLSASSNSISVNGVTSTTSTIGSTGSGSAGSGSAGGGTSSAKLSGTLNGSGSSFQLSFQQAAIQAFKSVQPGLTVNYGGGGSGKGRTDLASGTVNFAGSDSTIPDKEKANFKGKTVLDRKSVV